MREVYKCPGCRERWIPLRGTRFQFVRIKGAPFYVSSLAKCPACLEPWREKEDRKWQAIFSLAARQMSKMKS